MSLQHLPQEIFDQQFRKPVLEESLIDPKPDNLQAKNKNKELLAKMEREEIIRLLAKNQGNVSQVAREMGYSRRTIHRKIVKYAIEY